MNFRLLSIDHLFQSRLNKAVYLDGFYSGLFSPKICLLSVLVNLLFSCSTMILYSLGCREQVSDK